MPRKPKKLKFKLIQVGRMLYREFKCKDPNDLHANEFMCLEWAEKLGIKAGMTVTVEPWPAPRLKLGVYHLTLHSTADDPRIEEVPGAPFFSGLQLFERAGLLPGRVKVTITPAPKKPRERKTPK